jgi:hypothetical protein
MTNAAADMLQPQERKLYHPEAPIVRVLGLGPHKTPHFSDSLEDEPIKVSRPNKIDRNYSGSEYTTWTVFAVVVGLSLTSFFFNAGVSVVARIIPTFHVNNNVESIGPIASHATTTEEKLGSDDIEDAVSMQLTDASVYSLKPSTAFPKLSAKAFLIGDVDSGKIILSKAATSTYPFASVTKLMTVLVAKQVENLHDVATISPAVIATYGTEGELRVGEKIVTGDLVYPMLLESSNDAAEALAEHYGRSEFLALMNQKAATIGMFATNYEDASGLSYKNYGSAQDLLKLSQYIHKVMPEIFDATRIKEYDILNHHWTNHNNFLALSSFAGGKNGFTDEAKHTAVTLFTLPLKSSDGKVSEKRTLAFIILQSDNREGDIATLLNYVQHNVFLDTKISP